MKTLQSETAFTHVEMLMALGISGILFTGMFQLYLSSASGALVQTQKMQMQTDARAAMNLMAQDLRQIYGSATISTTLTPNDTISFTRLEDSGYSSGGNTASTLNDTRKSWATNMFAPSAAGTYSVQIIGGTGMGQTNPIGGNTASQLSLATGWGTLPDASSLYVITRSKTLTRTADNLLRSIAAGGRSTVLAANITSLSFSQLNASTISITEIARATAPDPRTQSNVYLTSYTLTQSATKRN
jgi:type II secretory pathway pseudopilin PulG